MKKVALEVSNVSKSFRLPTEQASGIKQAFINYTRGVKGYTEQKVLQDISFTVEKGDFFGIVGRNGSGKSTLLKLISQIYTPDNGVIEVNGKLVPFIELGVGFNPELTGRENIYLNGALLGFSHDEVSSMYSEIVEFAELEPFMDQRLKNYSSGMQVRLAFSIAIKARGDILVLDEVLAVGDEAFQRKCMDIFERHKASKQTVILVTHDMETVKNFCNKAILINDGKILARGNPQKVADHYSRLNNDQVENEMAQRESTETQQSSIKLNITSKDSRTKKASFVVGESVVIDISWDKKQQVEIVSADLIKLSGEHITSFHSNRKNEKGTGLLGGRNSVALSTKLSLEPGKYYFDVCTRKADKEESIVEYAYEVGEFIVLDDWSGSDYLWSGLVRMDHRWITNRVNDN